MLTIYRDSLMGEFGIRDYNIMYLNKDVWIKDYHQYLFIFDAIGVGKRNKLCNVVRKLGLSGLKSLEKKSLEKIKYDDIKIFDEVCRKMAEKKCSLLSLL